jgi:hypothetical protein
MVRLANSDVRGTAFAIVPKKYNPVSGPRKFRTTQSRTNVEGGGFEEERPGGMIVGEELLSNLRQN